MPEARQVLTLPVTRRGKIWLRANKPTSVAMLLSVAIVLVGILLYLWPQVRLVALGYQQSALRVRRQQTLQKQKELQIERATLRQPARIEEIALHSLGMQRPNVSQVIYVRPTQQTVTPGRER
jgi:cell division protein FtsL